MYHDHCRLRSVKQIHPMHFADLCNSFCKFQMDLLENCKATCSGWATQSCRYSQLSWQPRSCQIPCCLCAGSSAAVKLKQSWKCSKCGEVSPQWKGRCPNPSCGDWNTYIFTTLTYCLIPLWCACIFFAKHLSDRLPVFPAAQVIRSYSTTVSSQRLCIHMS